jgi:hypothetical protein
MGQLGHSQRALTLPRTIEPRARDRKSRTSSVNVAVPLAGVIGLTPRMPIAMMHQSLYVVRNGTEHHPIGHMPLDNRDHLGYQRHGLLGR